MKLPIQTIAASLIVMVSGFHSNAQTVKDSLPEKFVFSKGIDLPATAVKDQSASGTCWSFATTSFIESEILRMTKDTFDLSEMYFARKAYETKAQHFVRLHGTSNFGEGGQAHDVMNIIRASGMVTEKAYPGLSSGQTRPDQTELESLLAAMTVAIAKNPAGKLSTEWNSAISSVLDVYMGKVPETFGPANTTAPELAKMVHPDDYVEITSYTHAPFYSMFPLEVPDNWSGSLYYNVPLDELIQVMDYSLKSGYTFAWDGDVSDKGFSHKKAVAIAPEVSIANMAITERSKWEQLTEKERHAQFYSFEKPVPEKQVTQEMRQAAFDNYSATDDHLMHITGTVTDQNGKRYFRTKNSWASDSNSNGGYMNISEAYARLNTIAIIVHKDAIPKEIRKKLGIK
ncbi:MAG: C1 family peptidase [Bacteroidota bacterium]